MKKKKTTIRSHIILVTEGRLLTLIWVAGILWLLFVGFASDAQLEDFLLFWLTGIGFIIMLLPAIRFFWPLCWGKIILYDDKIVFKCFPMPRLVIYYDQIRDIRITTWDKKNVRDLYHTGHEYIIISTEPIPKKPLEKLYTNRKRIMFMRSQKLYQEIRYKVPKQFRDKFMFRC